MALGVMLFYYYALTMGLYTDHRRHAVFCNTISSREDHKFEPRRPKSGTIYPFCGAVLLDV